MSRYAGDDLPAGTAVSSTDEMYESMAAALDRVLNDPLAPVEPDRVWSLVFALARCRNAEAPPAPIRGRIAWTTSNGSDCGCW